ncbi:MAG: sensor histidine kinase [Zunongwangia sp.]|nr:HAMP domain-containing sensor histidine kinase [Zunongwangia profunda]MAG88063.1 sensor histidine kinase [Flavobacteriaceae bacterium]MAO36145.1 sensor histidine kinase [Zunongwangia sp.]MAS71284.1 sensor histidine kinase [Zunongwangia sp.]MCC4228645.1 HAMP domain-containing histidine kinase [Zunongwangia profunda]HAJ82393.1 sensor histidine kinase [Zunongwangia profunda]
MNRKLFVLLVVLMSLSLIGIIFVQGYWIKSTVQDREEQFSYNAKQVLIEVSEQIQSSEFERYIFEYEAQLRNSEQKIDRITLTEYLIATRDEFKNEDVFNFGTIQEADYKISSDFLGAEKQNDSIQIKKLINRKVTQIVKDKGEDSGAVKSASDVMKRVMRLEDYEKEILRDVISEAAARQPLRKRVSEKTIENLLTRGLASRHLNTKFEYAVYSNSIETGVHSENFDVSHPATYGVPLFVDREGNSSYQLLVNFNGKKGVVLSSVTLMAVLSIVFTLIIVIAYSSALSQLIRQRQISQIKTDFINNMTHEFKTPIATINLALDAIKNPKIISDQTKVFRYLQMIRDENKRMHAQVENVLRISKLEKNELDLNKERLQLHDIILDAITHVELIVEDRGGYIQTHFGALKSSILANQDHFTNVIVNILDNAIKYSEEEPSIDIYTENVKHYIIVKIRDQGAGMTRGVQKKIFEKFYREHTGDIHNVKGHGLGLAYVKQILDDHHGQITVNSEKGKGSTFIIKLPLIS